MSLATTCVMETNQMEQCTGEAHNNAIILNNLGCVLLQSGAFRDAFNTFRDAVDTLQTSARRVPNDPPDDNGKDKIMVALTRFRATERLHYNLDVSVVGLEDNAVRNLVFETSFGQSSHVVFTLRPPQSEGGPRDYDTDSSIMLHNFALSHIILAKYGFLQDRQAHKSALYVFRVAFRILFQRLEEKIDSDGYIIENETPSFDNFCGVVAVVLANLVYTLNHQGFERAARDGFLQLQEFFQNFSQSNCSILGRSSAAAAA